MLHWSVKKGIPKFVKEYSRQSGVQRLERHQSVGCVKSTVNAVIQKSGDTGNPWVSGTSRFEMSYSQFIRAPPGHRVF